MSRTVRASPCSCKNWYPRSYSGTTCNIATRKPIAKTSSASPPPITVRRHVFVGAAAERAALMDLPPEFLPGWDAASQAELQQYPQDASALRRRFPQAIGAPTQLAIAAGVISVALADLTESDTQN